MKKMTETIRPWIWTNPHSTAIYSATETRTMRRQVSQLDRAYVFCWWITRGGIKSKRYEIEFVNWWFSRIILYNLESTSLNSQHDYLRNRHPKKSIYIYSIRSTCCRIIGKQIRAAACWRFDFGKSRRSRNTNTVPSADQRRYFTSDCTRTYWHNRDWWRPREQCCSCRSNWDHPEVRSC